MKTMTQKERIIQYIKDFGSITDMEAFRDLGMTNFRARLSELRQEGYKFRKEMQSGKNRYGDKVHYYRYWLEQ